MLTKRLRERAACPACASPRHETLYTCRFVDDPIRTYLTRFYPNLPPADLEELGDGAFRVEHCGECGLLYQGEVPGEELLTRIYSRWIDPQASAARKAATTADVYERYAAEILQIIAVLGGRPDQLTLLDFGTGWARWARVAASFGCTVCGIDLAEERSAHARAFGIEMLTMADLAERRFDFINTDQVFEHLTEPADVLGRLAGALNPGGWLKIAVPHCPDILTRLEEPDWEAPKGSPRSLNAVAPLEHVNCFTTAALDALATRGGLKRVPLPLGVQYRFLTAAPGLRGLAKTLLTPIYRRWVRAGTYLFYRHQST